MGNYISWSKGKKAIMDGLNEQNPTCHISPKISEPEILSKNHQCQINMENDELKNADICSSGCSKKKSIPNDLSTTDESFPEKFKSEMRFNSAASMIASSNETYVNNRKWKSKSETKKQIAVCPKLLEGANRARSKGQRKSTEIAAKNDRSHVAMRYHQLIM